MKARLMDNDLVLTIPKKFNISAGTEFVASKSENGSITYIPKQENIFKKAVENQESLRTSSNEEYTYDLD